MNWVKKNVNRTFSKSKGWVTHAAAAEEIPPKYQRDNFLLLSAIVYLAFKFYKLNSN